MVCMASCCCCSAASDALQIVTADVIQFVDYRTHVALGSVKKGYLSLRQHALTILAVPLICFVAVRSKASLHRSGAMGLAGGDNIPYTAGTMKCVMIPSYRRP
jgi:hypothetical protein